MAIPGSPSRAPHLAPPPLWMRRFLTFLACMMLLQVFATPASWLVGLVPGYAEHMEKVLAAFPPGPLPSGIVTKYGPFPLVRFTHNLPAGFWAALVPVVLSPTIRLQRPRLHRLAGRTLLGLSTSLMVGVLLMLSRGLSMAHSPDEAQNTTFFAAKAHLDVSSAWFVATGALALVAAVRRRFVSHRAWALRHLCSGMWVSLMRVFSMLLMAAPPLGLAQYATREQQVDAFHQCSIVAWVGILLACEVALHQQRRSGAALAAVGKQL